MFFGPRVELADVDLMTDSNTERWVECLGDEGQDLANPDFSFGLILSPTAGEQIIVSDKRQPVINRNHTPISPAQFQKSLSLTDEAVRLILKIGWS